MLDEEAGRAAAQPAARVVVAVRPRDRRGRRARTSSDIDAEIEAHAQGWPLERMPALDRAIARLATWEILYNDEVPDAVAIAEAVESATVLSTEDSAGFLNGLLGGIARGKGLATA